MRNFIQEGDYISVLAPYAVEGGDGVKVGQMFGVAAGDAESGDPLEIAIPGVYELDKAPSQAWTSGVPVYWDDSAKVCTTTASGNLLVGVATEAVAGGSADTLGKVRLNGSFAPDVA